MRLIDRDAFHIELYSKIPKDMDADSYLKGGMDVLLALHLAPVVDAVPVVRCRDCKHYYKSPTIDDEMLCSRDALPHTMHWFCADGERREG